MLLKIRMIITLGYHHHPHFEPIVAALLLFYIKTRAPARTHIHTQFSNITINVTMETSCAR